MPPGSYLASDMLSCRDLAGRNKYARHWVSKVLTADGVIEITLDSPLQRWSSRWSSVTLTGECTYLTDSVNGNYNITVHNACQLVIKATATPRPFREDKKETQLLDGLQLHRRGFVVLTEAINADDPARTTATGHTGGQPFSCLASVNRL